MSIIRLWHEELISRLPRQQLLGQHRECCALRGNGWGRRHAVVDYVFTHSPYILWHYHMKVMDEMKRRGYQAEEQWRSPFYRGKSCPAYSPQILPALYVYPEHNEAYLAECLENLAQKGILLS